MEQQITSKQTKGSWGGRHGGNQGGSQPGVPRGPYGKNNLQRLRIMAQEHTENALERIVHVMNTAENPMVVLAAAGMILDRSCGKAREYVTVDSQETLTANYETVEEARAKLVAAGIPLDRLGQPKLIEHSGDDT